MPSRRSVFLFVSLLAVPRRGVRSTRALPPVSRTRPRRSRRASCAYGARGRRPAPRPGAVHHDDRAARRRADPRGHLRRQGALARQRDPELRLRQAGQAGLPDQPESPDVERHRVFVRPDGGVRDGRRAPGRQGVRRARRRGPRGRSTASRRSSCPCSRSRSSASRRSSRARTPSARASRSWPVRRRFDERPADAAATSGPGAARLPRRPIPRSSAFAVRSSRSGAQAVLRHAPSSTTPPAPTSRRALAELPALVRAQRERSRIS